VCVCVCERERVCVCVCVRERERECVCVRERERVREKCATNTVPPSSPDRKYLRLQYERALPLLRGAQVERAISGVQSARSAAQRATYWYNAVPYRGVSYVHRTLRRGLQWGAWLRPGAESKVAAATAVEGGGEDPEPAAVPPAPTVRPNPARREGVTSNALVPCTTSQTCRTYRPLEEPVDI
jgi:hypothetical protein